MRLSDWLDRLALAKPDLDFAIQGTRRISYQQAAVESDGLAQALLGAGLRTGDRFAVLAKNSIEYALLYFAATKTELTLVPLNYRLAPPEWCIILNDAGRLRRPLRVLENLPINGSKVRDWVPGGPAGIEYLAPIVIESSPCAWERASRCP